MDERELVGDLSVGGYRLVNLGVLSDIFLTDVGNEKLGRLYFLL
jgi:hypothetical protein